MTEILLVVTQLSGETIAKLPVDGQLTIGGVKQLLESQCAAAAKYQTLCISGQAGALQDAQVMASLPRDTTGGVAVQLVRKPAEANDLVQACSDGSCDVPLAKYASENGADINAKMTSRGHLSDFGGSGCSDLVAHLEDANALHYAARAGLLDVCNFLLGNTQFTGMDAHTSSPQAYEEIMRWNALLIAIQCDHADVAYLLATHERFTDVNCTSGETYRQMPALHLAAAAGFSDVFQALMKHPALTTINHVDGYDTTVLISAITGRGSPSVKADMCRMILQDERFTRAGAHCCRGFDCSGTALSLAMDRGLLEILQMLFKDGTITDDDLNSVNDYFGTVLHRAVAKEHTEMCRLVLESSRFHAVHARVRGNRIGCALHAYSTFLAEDTPEAEKEKGMSALQLAELKQLSEIVCMIQSWKPKFRAISGITLDTRSFLSFRVRVIGDVARSEAWTNVKLFKKRDSSSGCAEAWKMENLCEVIVADATGSAVVNFRDVPEVRALFENKHRPLDFYDCTLTLADGQHLQIALDDYSEIQACTDMDWAGEVDASPDKNISAVKYPLNQGSSSALGGDWDDWG